MRQGRQSTPLRATPPRPRPARGKDAATRAVEAERERVRGWLHDRVLQLVEYVAAGGYAEQADPEHLRRVAAMAADELRAYVDGRRAQRPEHLPSALAEVIADAEPLAGDVVIRLVAGPVEAPVPAPLVAALAAATHEALSNVRKHAQAAHATVHCRVDATAASVRIEDDGVGFDPATMPLGHGLRRSVLERLALAGGRAEVDSRPGGGTRVTLRVELSPRLRPALTREAA